MFETRSKIADRSGDLRIDRILLAAGWGGMVSFIQNQHCPTPKSPQVIAKWTSVGFIDEQAMRDQESGVSTPGIDAEPSLSTHTLHIVLVKNFESQTEACFQFFFPLEEHRRRARDEDFANFLAQ